MRFRIFFIFLLLLSAHFLIFSQENISFGNELSRTVEATLTKNNFSPIAQKLSETGQDDFAYNLILDFAPNDEGKTEEANAENTGNSRTEVIFCFTQEDFIAHESAILDFLSFFKETKRDWLATVLFSALDETEYKAIDSIKGTRVFAESVDDTDSACAIPLSFDSSQKNALYTGSKSHTTPLWLTQRITDAFFDAQIDFSFEDVLSAVYRLGIIRGRERLSFFFMNNIPAVELSISDDTALSALKTFVQNYTPRGTEEWDMHYMYINRANLFKAVFVNERTIIIICLSVGIFTILILCVFSFTGKSGERHKYEFIKSLYMIPITIGISFASLALGQHIVAILSTFLPLNPVVQFGIKIVFSLAFISVLFAVQEIFKFSVTAFVYGYLLMVVAIFNIFLFSTRDLTLFVIFALEYIIIYVSRSAKKLPVLIIFFIVMVLPFAPYGYIIIKNADEADIVRSVFCTGGGNFLLAFAMFPFQIMWLRILMFMNIYAGGKGYSMRRIIFNDVVSTAGILAFVALLIFSISQFIYRPEVRKSQRIETKILREEKLTLSASLSSDSFSGMNTNHINIKSDENALRYEIKVHEIGGARAIYDSIYNYTIETGENGEDVYSFIIPDYPPKEITIDYACDVSAKARIEITAFYRTDKPHTFRTEKRELKVE